uniref:NADH-ubiquinone oxidoreductase chain 5 n=1 Tax=Zancudomyces culisetae TaxID=1213189 RepID=Q3T4C9_ZANCU|nr:NADH dehydrogenase subunit 5 [Zancudomyces culisetae]AAW49485.1 NADH dehydrogenase subunit 5 [Zancudomyces culisetae]
MYTILIIIPLISAIISGLLGRYIGQKGSGIISSICIGITAILAIISFYEIGITGSPLAFSYINWIDLELLEINWGLYLDSLTVSMAILVTLISTCVHIFSIGYMEGDPHKQRFFSYLSLFTFFMLLLISADNLLFLFIGWEGIGICSFLLINFWYTRLEANKSAMLALIMNRVGDWSISIGIYIIFYIFGSISFTTIFSVAHNIEENTNITLFVIPLFIGAMAKSAQLGLNTWLPRAMEGPTPVSALLHAATMVTAGVYLLIRISPVLQYSNITLTLIILIGSISALLAALMALTQNDIKKIIAYSTMSQLAYCFIACGICQYDIAIFHIVNHGFFKALLFLSAGAILHSIYDEQNIYKIGGFINIDPLIYIAIFSGSLSLMAFPFLTGFYSKDFIIAASLGTYIYIGSFAYWFGTITAFLTSIYSIKLICLVYLIKPYGPKKHYILESNHSIYITIPIIFLTIFSIFFGYFFKDLFIGFGTPFWGNSLSISYSLNLLEAEFSNSNFYSLLPLCLSLIALFFTIFYYFYNSEFLAIRSTIPKLNYFSKFKYIFSNGYYLDAIYASFIIKPYFYFSNLTNKVLDQGVFEFLGPTGFIKIFKNINISISYYDTGIIPHYGVYIILSLIIFFFLLFIKPLIILFFVLTLLFI